jgi:hypothetical protein
VGIYVNPGKDNFERAVHSQIYVDKTGLMRAIVILTTLGSSNKMKLSV